MPATITVTLNTEAQIEAMRAAIKEDRQMLDCVGGASEIEHGTFEVFKPSRALERAFNIALNKARSVTATGEEAATPKQLAFLQKLINRDPAFASNFISTTDGLTKRQASRAIDNLLAGA